MDPWGLAYFAKKALGDGPWIPGASNNPIDDYLNTEISHEQIFFEDKIGGNIGFTKDDRYGVMGLFGVAQGVLWEDTNPKGYRKTRTGFDDILLRKAIENVLLRPYQLLWIGKGKKFNCQDWAEEVRKEYERLKKEKGIKEK